MSVAQQELFKMAANDEEQYNTLLDYYRGKIAEFEKERIEWLSKIEEIRISYEDRHKLQWELNKRRDEIAELSRSISEAKIMLFEERELNLRLIRENDLLKVAQLEDRKKLSELLKVEEAHVILQKDIRPELTQKYGANEVPIKQVKRLTISQGPTSRLKTIYIPNEHLNAVAQENESLKRQLDSTHQLLNQQMAALKQEIENIKAQTDLRAENDSQIKCELLQKIQKLERHNIEMNKDFYQQRLQWSERERQIQEENDHVRQRNTNLLKRVQDLQNKTTSENRAAIELIEKRSEEYNRKFKKQAKQKEENLNILKEQSAQIQQIYIQKIKQLEDNLSKMIDKYQQLERRRVLEIEGFKNDIKKLNIRVKELDLKQSQRSIHDEKDEIQKYQEEAQWIKEEAKRKMQETYNASPKRATKKKLLKPTSSSGKKFDKTQKGRVKYQEEQEAQEDYDQQFDEAQHEHDQESSLPIQDLEEIQRQLEELETKMDQARRQ